MAPHPSPYSGSWYPESASELIALLDELSQTSCGRIGPHLWPDALAYVVPHAGPAYSGIVASAVYRSLAHQRPEQIVLLAFPHHGGLRGVAVPDVDAIETPLGVMQVERAGFRVLPERQLCDHSFEIQLPFLQRAVPEARISPLYVGRMDESGRRETAETLAAMWRPGVVFLASSDFTHYERQFGYTPFPADGLIAGRLRALDFECIDAAGSLDASLFLETLHDTGATVCGADPIALLLETLRVLGDRDIYQATLEYQTSGDLTGDFEHTVSYAALGYYRRAALELHSADCEALLDAASESLDRLRRTGRRDPVLAVGSSALQARRGAFAGLHRGPELLGCVGNLGGRGPLAHDVPELALSAALEDDRFERGAALRGAVDIEISVLTPFRRIRSIEQFELGRHGAFFRLGAHSGLLLPQVAGHREWTSETFFEALARKSLAGKHAWRDPKARLSVFEAQIFSRSGLPARS